jgi:formate-dependent phosphoribosylglycinamide formyltransferase (GAR transformylase)
MSQNIDKNALKKLVDSTKPNDILVSTVNAIEKDGVRRIKSEVEKFLSKSSDYVVILVRK